MPISLTEAQAQTRRVAAQEYALNIEQYLPPEVRERLSRDLVRRRINPNVVEANANAGVKAITKEPIRKRIAEALPEVDLAPVIDIPRLAATYGYACRTATPLSCRDEELQSAIRRGYRLRRILFSQIDALTSVGLLAEQGTSRRLAGSGVINMANDLRDSAELVAKHWSEIAGKTALTDALLTEARDVGRLLKERVRPGKLGTRRRRESEGLAMVEDRHLLFALLAERYSVVRRIGYWIWADEFDHHTPALGGGVRKRPRQKPLPAPVVLLPGIPAPPVQPANELRG